MKELNNTDPYSKSSITRDTGYKTNNGIIRIIGNYEKGVIKYVTISNQNGLKVHVSAALIPELMEMLGEYT